MIMLMKHAKNISTSITNYPFNFLSSYLFLSLILGGGVVLHQLKSSIVPFVSALDYHGDIFCHSWKHHLKKINF
ncbi:hypothetical protein BGC07_17510 [Piscirickettsia litoralis]|uniref:Uncharacterized protein n=1 Tax=Piscirickettsia litoralis TaxID=1891921 RepID=A0ABX3A0J0_9GAMM|nr:hypothetical protein BGC07_17510 [Piscirickettsia litoralis]